MTNAEIQRKKKKKKKKNKNSDVIFTEPYDQHIAQRVVLAVSMLHCIYIA